MHEEAIDQIMVDVALYGNLHKDGSPHDNGEAISEIRQRVEELAAGPGVTRGGEIPGVLKTPMPWRMIEDGESYVIINLDYGRVYCRGMTYNDAWELVRKLNGIEE